MTSISEIQALIDGPIPAELQPAIDEYCRWQKAYVETEQSRVQVSVPLYHYTSLNALRGIIGSESVWCTDYRHMNDKNELSHGVEVAKEALARLATQADGRVRLLCQCVEGLLDIRNFDGNLDSTRPALRRSATILGNGRDMGIMVEGSPLAFPLRCSASLTLPGYNRMRCRLSARCFTTGQQSSPDTTRRSGQPQRAS